MLKRRTSEEINKWPKKLIYNELTPESLEILSVENVVQFQKNLNRTSSEFHPTLPKMVSQLHATVSQY